MPSATYKNNTIIKNTGLLYVRMFFTLAVSLFTSRIILNTLGVIDFGLFNVVGSVISTFLFINMSMAATTQRFLSFELGKGNHEKLIQLFSSVLNIHIVIALLILILAETLGLWFLYNKLNIPNDRLSASLWVYQFSVFSALIAIIQVPYNASIKSHEKMGVIAYFSIIEVSLNLILVYILTLIEYDKLKLYAILVFLLKLGVAYGYRVYCKKSFSECHYKFYFNKELYKQLISYSGWSLFGNISVIAKGHAVNILLNLFYGPILNAAMGIANQVSNAINSFFLNFQMAANPQIIKSYASKEIDFMMNLIYRSSKFSFLLLFLLSLPVLIETNYILKLWLGIVPEFAVIFTSLGIINILVDSISGSLITAAHASGRIKNYQIIVGSSLILSLPISYLFLKLGYKPEITLYIGIFTSIVALFLRLIILKNLINISIKKFISQVLLKILYIIIFSVILPLFLKLNLDEGFMRFAIVTVSSIICIVLTINAIGINKEEKTLIKNSIRFLLKNEK